MPRLRLPNAVSMVMPDLPGNNDRASLLMATALVRVTAV